MHAYVHMSDVTKKRKIYNIISYNALFSAGNRAEMFFECISDAVGRCRVSKQYAHDNDTRKKSKHDTFVIDDSSQTILYWGGDPQNCLTIAIGREGATHLWRGSFLWCI